MKDTTTKKCGYYKCKNRVPRGTKKYCSYQCSTAEKKKRDRAKTLVLKKQGLTIKGLDAIWKSAVKDRDGWKCMVCGAKKGAVQIHAHHIFTRSRKSTLWDLNNGISLCASHHKFSGNKDFPFSAHESPECFRMWLLKNWMSEDAYFLLRNKSLVVDRASLEDHRDYLLMQIEDLKGETE